MEDMSKRFRATEATRQNSTSMLEVRGLIRVIIDNSAHTHRRQLALIQSALNRPPNRSTEIFPRPLNSREV